MTKRLVRLRRYDDGRHFQLPNLHDLLLEGFGWPIQLPVSVVLATEERLAP